MMSAKLWKTEAETLRFEYDFDVQGGAIGTIVLGTLPDNFVMTEVYHVVETLLESAGTPVVEFGNDADQDGFVPDIGLAVAGETEKSAGALVTGGAHLVLAADDSMDMEIGTAALTAGKLAIYVRGFQA